MNQAEKKLKSLWCACSRNSRLQIGEKRERERNKRWKDHQDAVFKKSQHAASTFNTVLGQEKRVCVGERKREREEEKETDGVRERGRVVRISLCLMIWLTLLSLSPFSLPYSSFLPLLQPRTPEQIFEQIPSVAANQAAAADLFQRQFLQPTLKNEN